MATDLTGAAVAKRLASCNKGTRDRTVRLLQPWLSAPSASASVTDEDLLKVWKGLFYCVWHSDKLPVQLELINRLASLLPALPPLLAARYFEAFIVTIRREWSGIDQLRLDKFYLLIRRFIHHMFLLLRDNKWDPEIVGRMISLLSEKSLLLVDKYAAEGVNYHLAQVFIDEVREFLPVNPATLHLLFKPFFSAVEKSLNKVLVGKIKSNVFDRLLTNGEKYLKTVKDGGAVETGSEEEKLGKIALAYGFSNIFFDLASSSDTVQGNRKVLFALHQQFLKLENDVAKSGVQVSLSFENEVSDNDVSAAESTVSDLGSNRQGQVVKQKRSRDENVTKRKKAEKPSISGGKSKKSPVSGGKKPKNKGNAGLNGTAINEIMGTPVAATGTHEDESSMKDDLENGDLVTFDEIFISNLQKQFEKVAAEDGMITPVASCNSKKRRRAKSDGKLVQTGAGSGNEGSARKGGDKSAKRVRFSMKNNLVWKPQSPLPPQSLRIPPSVTPRGSALKKGVPPGPVKESPTVLRKVKAKVNSVKRVSRRTKTGTPTVKRIRKLQSFSV